MRHERFSGLQSAIGVGLLCIVLLSALALGGNRPVSWSLLTIGVALFFAGQALLAFFTPVPLATRRALWPGVFFMAAVFWGWIQSTPGLLPQFAHPFWDLVPKAQPAISADPGQGRHAVMRLIGYAMVFVTMTWTCSSSQRATVILKIIALFSSGLAFYGLYGFATGTNIFLGDLTRPDVVQASFVNRNSYATYAAFGVLANIAAYLHLAQNTEDSVRDRLEMFFSSGWVYAIGVLLCLGAVSLTQSRAGGAATLLGLAAFSLCWRLRGRTQNPMMFGLLLGAIIFISATSATGLLERLIATDATEGRFLVYPRIITGILDRSLLGHGLGAFHDSFRPYIAQEAATGEWVRAHSTYLEMIFGLGLPAAGSLFLALILLTSKIWQGTIVRRNNRIFPCFALSCIAVAAFHSGFDFSLQMPASAALFSVILALGYAQSFTRETVKTWRNGQGIRKSRI